MRYPFLVSALLAASLAAVGEAGGSSHQSGQVIPEVGVTCQLKAGQFGPRQSPCSPTANLDAMSLSLGPPGQPPPVFAEMYDGDAVTASFGLGPNAAAFLVFSEDAAICNVFALDEVEAQAITTNYCNKTQLDDCAKVTLICGKPDPPASAHAQPQPQSIAEPVALPPQRETLAPVVQLVAPDTKAQGPGVFPHGAVLISNSPPDTKLQPDMQGLLPDREPDGASRSRAPSKPATHASAVVAENMTATNPSKKKLAGTWPSASGSTHIIGMAGGLGVVLLIFVIWM
ncbi:hypothetical protein ACRALDRAFT_1079440 [Sodiomyces alcalophilus JCM 7366]|uniref:uncharacterized protein n=1 Tax=Sodiomyces alcalophilus JCM 7366 TaxID=591952 RepID=UPI0039B660FC